METDTRDRILAAATECFNANGFKRASIGLIAEKADVAKGTIYLYAKDKRDLYYQALHGELRRWIAAMSRKIDRRRRADDLLMDVSWATLEFLAERPLLRDLMFGASYGLLPAYATQFDELRELGSSFVLEILELGVKQEIFDGRLDLPTVAKALSDMHATAVIQRHRMPERLEELAVVQAQIFNLALRGLRPQ